MTLDIHPSCFVAPNATILGNVKLAKHCSVWFSAVIRGDQNNITIGEGSNIQDNCTIHVDATHSTSLGRNVTMGHNCLVHGATIGDDVIIGMGAVVLNGAKVGTGSIIGAGAVVKENQEIPPGSLVVGIPAKLVKENDPDLKEYAVRNAKVYVELAKRHISKSFEVYKP